MRPGMVFTIEPCISEGDRRVRTLEDGWTAVTLVSCQLACLVTIFINVIIRIAAEQPKLSTPS